MPALSFALTLATIVGIVLLVIFAPEHASTYVPILAGVGGLSSAAQSVSRPLGHGAARRVVPPLTPRGGFVQLRVLALVALVALVVACGGVYTGARSTLSVGPNPAAPETGMQADLVVDGDRVCRVTGARSTLSVHASVAERVCAAFPQCVWEPEQ